jgi:branched-chain amino acid transport system ATP-binding protein
MLFRIRDLEVHYGGAIILRGISLELQIGEIITLIGSNGAGKTTTLRTISGLKRSTHGEIWFNGGRIDELSPQDIAKRGINQVPEGRGLFPYMSVSENLTIGAYLRRDAQMIREDLERIYQTFPVLKARKRQLAGTLSGGEQQMLAISSALMGKPKLLLLDEPSTGLSPIMVGEIGKAVSRINKQGTSVLLVEQNARLALGIAHRGYVLETGRIILQGRADELIGSPYVKKAYLGQ